MNDDAAAAECGAWIVAVGCVELIVVDEAVGRVDIEHDPDFTRINQIGDVLIHAVLISEHMHRVESHLDRQVFTRMLVMSEECFRLVLVYIDVVGDLA